MKPGKIVLFETSRNVRKFRKDRSCTLRRQRTTTCDRYMSWQKWTQPCADVSVDSLWVSYSLVYLKPHFTCDRELKIFPCIFQALDSLLTNWGRLILWHASLQRGRTHLFPHVQTKRITHRHCSLMFQPLCYPVFKNVIGGDFEQDGLWLCRRDNLPGSDRPL